MNTDYIANPLYDNNPFIEALPPMLAGKNLIRALASIPPYSDNDRDCSTGERLQLLSSLYEYYQPLSMTIDLYCEVYTALQHCYGQYSMQRDAAALQNDYALMRGNASAASIGGGNSFSVIGVSGLGKSTALQRVLSLFPQVIEHTQYHGQNFYYHQIPYLKNLGMVSEYISELSQTPLIKNAPKPAAEPPAIQRKTADITGDDLRLLLKKAKRSGTPPVIAYRDF